MQDCGPYFEQCLLFRKGEAGGLGTLAKAILAYKFINSGNKPTKMFEQPSTIKVKSQFRIPDYAKVNSPTRTINLAKYTGVS